MGQHMVTLLMVIHLRIVTLNKDSDHLGLMIQEVGNASSSNSM